MGAALSARDNLWDDPAWFPVDLDVPQRRFGFLRIDGDVLERSAFLDTRIEAPLVDVREIAVTVVQAHSRPPARLAWLFHTSFCGSTLLARALHVAPVQMTLKEPLILRRLADARAAGWPIDGLVDVSVRLLARPWSVEGAVIIKPTHAALNIALELVEAAPQSRAVLLTSHLEDFLVSNIKKKPETQAKIPQLAERALRASSLGQRLSPAAFAPPNLLAAATLQWAAQRELATDLLERVGAGRIRVVDMRDLLEDLPTTTLACSAWLQGTATPTALAARTARVASVNAKATGVPYDSHQRLRDAAFIRQRFAREIEAALDWYSRHVHPLMRGHAVQPPAKWRLPPYATESRFGNATTSD